MEHPVLRLTKEPHWDCLMLCQESMMHLARKTCLLQRRVGGNAEKDAAKLPRRRKIVFSSVVLASAFSYLVRTERRFKRIFSRPFATAHALAVFPSVMI